MVAEKFSLVAKSFFFHNERRGEKSHKHPLKNYFKCNKYSFEFRKSYKNHF